MGPSTPPENVQTRQEYGPTPSASGSAVESKIILAFGPGYSRGYAASGVLRALSDMKIDISRIYAHEVSAVVSAIHLASRNSNQVDWALMKIGDTPLARQGGISFSITGPEGRVEDRFAEIFKDRHLEDLTPQLGVALYGEENGELQLVSQGRIRNVVRQALGGRDTGLRPADFQGKRVHGRGKNPVEFLRQIIGRENEPVWYVSFQPLDLESEAYVRDQNIAVTVIDMGQLSEGNFKKRKDAIYQGRIATKRETSLLMKLIGREDAARETTE